MKVFISWSGDRSKFVAESLRKWLKQVINALDPWISTTDIDNGTRWRDHIAVRLKDSHVGIICVTPESLKSEWLLFEAGAISKTIETAHVCPLLIDLDPSDISGPLAQFQATRANRDEIRALVRVINAALGDNARPEQELNEAFDALWPHLENRLKEVPMQDVTTRPQRPDRDILEEILAHVRDQSRAPTRVIAPAREQGGAERPFETALRTDLEAVPGVNRATVESFADHYLVTIETASSKSQGPKAFKFLWDEEPLNSSGQRALEAVTHFMSDYSGADAKQELQRTDDTSAVARYRKSLIEEFRRRRLDTYADVAAQCSMEISGNRLKVSASRLYLLCWKEERFKSVAVRVYRLLFGAPPEIDLNREQGETVLTVEAGS